MHVLITGGAGYIGSLLTGELLRRGDHVTSVDTLLFGGDSIVAYLPDPRFSFRKLDVTSTDLAPLMKGVDVVYHLAAIVGFPACQQVGDEVAYRFNTESTKRVFEAAEHERVSRFVLASTYSNYGKTKDDRPVTEEAPLYPQSLYAQTKIAAEEYLRGVARTSHCAPIIPRFTTLYGVSPRTRFDLIVNQFVLEALTNRKLVIYQGDYRRAFVHVRDIVQALLLFADAPIEKVRGEVFNVGAEDGNFTKTEIVRLISEAIPGISIEHRDLSFGGDMRDVAVSCTKIRERLAFAPRWTVPAGIAEVRDAIQLGVINEPTSARYRNHTFIVH